MIGSFRCSIFIEDVFAFHSMFWLISYTVNAVTGLAKKHRKSNKLANFKFEKCGGCCYFNIVQSSEKEIQEFLKNVKNKNTLLSSVLIFVNVCNCWVMQWVFRTTKELRSETEPVGALKFYGVTFAADLRS